ncbi:MAG TPA: PHP domain-containing protein [Actinomycetota bacterium]|nr:PHP domain-containing protein [Actinomycetota bacterium]
MPTNLEIAELLARESEVADTDRRRRALRRASRHALGWEQEAADVVASGAPITTLSAVGPWIAGKIRAWLDDPPERPDPPPERAGFMTRAEARRILASSPDWSSPRADLQVHTTWSDGHASLDEMVRVASTYGYDHVAITDHSKGLPIANGMDEPTLAEQGREIARLNRTLDTAGAPIRALRSLEMNLSPEGDGDMEADALERLDLVLGAFHSKLRVREDQTRRYVAALRNPRVHVLAHPRGRRWSTRAGLSADWETVVTAASETRTALEIDAYPDRQDLDVATLRLAAEAQAWISIGTDAHYPDELRFLELGLAAAVEAGIRRERVLNFLPRDDLLAWARER